jgi:uncharacterized membrane protein YcaP (DUF421 family)
MTGQLGVEPYVAFQVVVATVGIYLAFLVLLRLVGQRSLAAMSASDIACVVAVGAVVGRTTLLAVPTLATGLIALVTLFLAQWLVRIARRCRPIALLLDREPVLLVVDGRVLDDAVRRVRISDDELRQSLRLAGLSRMEQVGRLVLERNGQISVLRRDDDLDPRIVADVPGALPERGSVG